MNTPTLSRTFARTTLATLIVAAFNIAHPPLAQAQASSQSIAESRRQFDIPAAPLNQAITQFSRQAGLNVIFESPADNDASRAAPVKGLYSAGQALQLMLQGTGYEIAAVGENGFRIRLAEIKQSSASVLPSVNVSASSIANAGDTIQPYAGGQVAKGARLGIFDNRDQFEVPFSVVPFTRELIDNQQARTVVEVLRNDSSITINQGANSGGTDDVYNIRGFLGSSSFATIDGLSGLTGRSQPLESMERVELLKGPTAFVNGAPGLVVGGSINFVPKRASDEPITRLITRYYSDSVVGVHGDVGRRFGESNEFGVRFNGAIRDGDAAVDQVEKRNELSALALDYRGQRFRASADFEYSYAATTNFLGGTGIADGVPVPEAPENTNNWAQAFGFDYPQKKNRFIVRGEYDLSDSWSASLAYGELDQRDGDYISCDSTLINGAGDVSYDCYRGGSQGDFSSVEGKLKGLFTTGSVVHRVVLGSTRTQQEFAGPFVSFAFNDPVTGNPRQSNIYQPVYHPTPQIPDAPYLGKFSQTNVRTYFVGDELSMLDDRLLISVGLRRVEFDFGSFDEVSGQRTSRTTKAANTPAFGALYKLNSQWSVYGNYAEALEQGGTAPNNATVDNPGAVIEPLKSDQIEIGFKVDKGDYGLTAAVFQIDKANTLIVNRIFGNFGRQLNQGVEFNVFGEPVQGARLLASATYLDATLEQTANGAFDGKQAVGVPELQARFGGEYDVPQILPGLTLTGGIAYSDKVFVDQNNSRSVPSWVRVDAGARYKTCVGNVPTTFLLNVENLLDDNYWASVDRSFLYLGQPRTVSVSAIFDF